MCLKLNIDARCVISTRTCYLFMPHELIPRQLADLFYWANEAGWTLKVKVGPRPETLEILSNVIAHFNETDSKTMTCDLKTPNRIRIHADNLDDSVWPVICKILISDPYFDGWSWGDKVFDRAAIKALGDNKERNVPVDSSAVMDVKILLETCQDSADFLRRL